jgi:pyruvate dehydrogenase E1 component alpha subunit
MLAPAEQLELYRSMLRIRRTEEALATRYREQQMRCPMHLCIGQEAVAAGVCHVLRKTDRVFSNHRAHGHYLAKGGDLRRMLAELYGRENGCCAGRGGSMHLIDLDAGFLGSTPIVGGTVPLAVGTAWSAQLRGEAHVTVVFFGDGCFEEGVLHESMNFAALHALPIVFVCENNDYSVYTPLRERQPMRSIAGVARAHGLTVAEIDGNDVTAVQAVASDAVAAARVGQGPQFIEASLYRWLEHCGPDDDSHLGYRSAQDIAHGRSQCPLAKLQVQLTRAGVLDSHASAVLEDDIGHEIDAAFSYAIKSPYPAVTDLERHLFA